MFPQFIYCFKPVIQVAVLRINKQPQKRHATILNMVPKYCVGVHSVTTHSRTRLPNSLVSMTFTTILSLSHKHTHTNYVIINDNDKLRLKAQMLNAVFNT
jgi:hypothetical protein